MKIFHALAVFLALALPVSAEQEFHVVQEHGDWSVFTDNQICWVSSFSLTPALGDLSPRIFITFENSYDMGQLSVFDPKQFLRATEIAIFVNSLVFPLDLDLGEREYAFDNNFDLVAVLIENDEATVAFPDEQEDIVNYNFSLYGLRDAIAFARNLCRETT
jgi:hypothetical protein